jgi:hypothetical protein
VANASPNTSTTASIRLPNPIFSFLAPAQIAQAALLNFIGTFIF